MFESLHRGQGEYAVAVSEQNSIFNFGLESCEIN